MEKGKLKTKQDFIRMNKSLVHKHDYLKDKPFVVTLHQIKQLAQTPVGYGLNMLEIFDMSEAMLKQQKLAVQ